MLDIITSLVAVALSSIALVVSWKTSTRSNQLNSLNTLVTLRQHYFDMFRKEADLAETYKEQVSVVRSAGESASIAADRMREIDGKIAWYYDKDIARKNT